MRLFIRIGLIVFPFFLIYGILELHRVFKLSIGSALLGALTVILICFLLLIIRAEGAKRLPYGVGELMTGSNYIVSLTGTLLLLFLFLLALDKSLSSDSARAATPLSPVTLDRSEAVVAGNLIDSSIKFRDMNISSPSFAHQETIPPIYTCDGDDINPPLNFSEVPPDAKSLVLIMEDPDAPSATFTHWTVWNIDPASDGVAEDSVFPEAVEGITSFGSRGYGGPCPPSNTHRYFFKLFALDKILDLGAESTVDVLLESMDGHVLDEAELIGLYERK